MPQHILALKVHAPSEEVNTIQVKTYVSDCRITYCAYGQMGISLTNYYSYCAYGQMGISLTNYYYCYYLSFFRVKTTYSLSYTLLHVGIKRIQMNLIVSCHLTFFYMHIQHNPHPISGKPCVDSALLSLIIVLHFMKFFAPLNEIFCKQCNENSISTLK